MSRKNTNTAGKKKDLVGPFLTGIYMVFLIVSVAIFVKTVIIQVKPLVKEEYEQYFHPKEVKKDIVPVRGRILTCDGRPLAITVPYYDIYMDCTVRKQEFKEMDEKETEQRRAAEAKGKPITTPRKDAGAKAEALWQSKADSLSQKLAGLLGNHTAAEYRKLILDGREGWHKADGRWVGETNLLIMKNVDRQTLLTLKTFPLFNEHSYRGGLKVVEHDERIYPYDTLARRTIGTMKDNSQRGLEYSFDKFLHGKDGYEELRISEHNQYVHDYAKKWEPAEDGLDVRTTLNIDFQGIADRALRRQIDQDPGIRGGIAVILEVETGAVRAMVNLVRDTIPGSPLRERDNLVIRQRGEQGSVMKTVTLTSLIEDGLVSLDQRIATNNGRIPGVPSIPVDDHVRGMRDISIIHGLEISSNYVFARLAQLYYSDNPQRYYDHLFAYGLGTAFDFDIEGLAKPEVHTPGSKLYSGSTLLTNAYGYGLSITPLHLAMFYNAIANKGRMMKPYLVEDLEKDGRVVKKYGPAFMNNICSAATADTVTRALRAVVTHGTGATHLSKAKLHIAGKTGTARAVLMRDENPNPKDPYVDKYGRHKFQGTFVGFFPAEQPKYTLLITVYSYPSHANYYGGDKPARAYREIVDQIYAIDEGWSENRPHIAEVPLMEIPERDNAEGRIPNLKGLGLSDALWEAESRGLRCTYTGSGHVQSQKPAAGTVAKEGDIIEITLK
jgi:cell division protein FtsI (penicillin-binding protein 3)